MDKNIIDELTEKLRDIADDLYKGKTEIGMSRMNEVIPDMVLVTDTIQDEAVTNRMVQDALNPLLGAMEDRDATLMADIIMYELIEILKDIA